MRRRRRTYSPEMLAMLMKLASHGHSASSIAGMLNLAFGSVLDGGAIRNKAAACGIVLRRAKDAVVLQVSLSRETERALRSAARDRGQRLERLAQDLLAVLASDRLIDAVLDVPVPATRTRRRPNGAAVNAAASRS
jgi:hypothetical protein